MSATGDRAFLTLPSVPRLRLFGIVLASVLACAAGAHALFPTRHRDWFLLIPVVSLAVAVLCAVLAPLWAQLLARAVQWSNLGLGLAMTILGSSDERPRGLLLALACGSTLLVLDQHGLAEAERRADFVPAAFRNSLLLLIVLAMADSLSFALFGSVSLQESVAGMGVLLLAAAALLVVGFVLLLRLSVRGLYVNAAACVLAAASVPLAARHQSEGIDAMLLILSVVHLLVLVVVAASIRRGRALLSSTARSRKLVTRGVILALMALAILSTMARST